MTDDIQPPPPPEPPVPPPPYDYTYGYPPLPPPPPLFDPDRPFPGFGIAILLCVLFLFCTQVPGAVVAVILLVFFVIANPAKFQGLDDPMALLATPEASLAMGAAVFVTQICVIAFSLLALRICFGRDWARRVAFRWPGWTPVLLTLASIPAFVLMANLVAAWVAQGLAAGGKPNPADPLKLIEELVTSWPVVVGILLIGVGPGIGEELWCRAFLGRGLIGWYGVATGVVMASFLFGAIHVLPIQVAYASLMGLWLHYVYLTTRSLWMPILVHALNNSLAILSVKLPALGAMNEGVQAAATGPWSGQVLPILAFVVLFVAAGWALYRTRGQLVGPGDWRPPFLSVDCPPPGVGVEVGHARLGPAGALLVCLAFLGCLAVLYSLAAGQVAPVVAN